MVLDSFMACVFEILVWEERASSMNREGKPNKRKRGRPRRQVQDGAVGEEDQEAVHRWLTMSTDEQWEDQRGTRGRQCDGALPTPEVKKVKTESGQDSGSGQ